MFDIVWLGRHVALQASNGKYVCTKKNGQLAAVSDSIGGRGHIPKQNCSRSNRLHSDMFMLLLCNVM